MVPRSDLSRAVALGSVAFNVARAVGPARGRRDRGGAELGHARSSSAPSSSCRCSSRCAARRRGKLALPGVPERLLSGVMSGLRYVRHSAPMRAFIVRNLAFSVCASAFWALLPVIARDQLGLGAGGFGLLSASFGIGAIVGAISIPGLLQRQSMNKVVTSGGHLWALAIFIVALTGITALALVGAVLCRHGMGVRVRDAVGGNAEQRARLGARARRRR